MHPSHGLSHVWEKAEREKKKEGVYHPELRLLDGDEELDAAADEAAADAWIQPSAISAASSLALLRFLPSYQNRAATVCPLMTTRLDQAVRPPVPKERKQSAVSDISYRWKRGLDGWVGQRATLGRAAQS